MANDVSARLKAVRLMHGLSQRELAKRAGVTNGMISLIEQGRVSPSVASLKKVLDGLPAGGLNIAPVLHYEDRPVGTLAMADRRMRMTEVRLRPRITLALGADAGKARELVDATHDRCFVASSITSAVHIEPDVAVAP